MTDDVRNLLGGYATGTLTDAEKQVLYEAALTDEQLFEALANEQALKELLDDPAGRAQVLQAVQTSRFSIGNAFRQWFDRPRAKALVATGAVLVIAIAVRQGREQESASYVAGNSTPPRMVTVSPATPPTQAPEKPQPATVPREARPQPRKQLADSARAARPEAVMERLPEPVMMAAAPVAIREEQQSPPDAFRQTAKSGSTELRYVLLKRTASGDFTAVPPTFSFTESDELRLSVQVNERGIVQLTSDKNATPSSALVEPGRTFTLAVPAGSRTIALSFRHGPRELIANTLVPSGAASAERETRAKSAAPAARSTAVQTEDSARLLRSDEPSAPLISVEIKLTLK